MLHTHEVKAELKRMAQECDSIAPPPGAVVSGYYATKHQLMPGCAMVWAPCGCVLVGNTHGDALLTICKKPECDFDWSAAVLALSQLESLEPPKNVEVRSEETTDEENLSSLVPSVD